MTEQKPLNFSFSLLSSGYYNALLNRDILPDKIIVLNEDIDFIKGIDAKRNTTQTNFYTYAYAQLSEYSTALSEAITDTDNLYKERNKVLCSIWQTSNSHLKHYQNALNDNTRKILISMIKDITQYATIDKRQRLNKTDILTQVYKWYKKGLCSKSEYRHYKRHGRISENLKGRITFYIGHTLLKIGHKKHYNTLLNSRKIDDRVYYQPFDRLIKFRPHALTIFYDWFINREIDQKIRAEQKFKVVINQ